jgi:carbamoyl-phosphate synthase large subunit
VSVAASNPPALLLLSGASLVGQNVLEALGADRRRFRLVATTSVADAAPLQEFDEVHLVPETRVDPDGLARVVEGLIESTQPCLVIPCRDDDVVFLARLGERRPELARRLLAGAPDTAEILLDKWRSWTFSRDHGLPFAPSLRRDDADGLDAFVAAHGFPLVVKPRYGFASRGVSLVLDRAQLDAAPRTGDLLVQRYLGDPATLEATVAGVRARGWPLFFSFEDTKCSIQALLGPDGRVVDVCGTLHVMRQGASVAVSRDDRDDIRALGLRCARAFAAAGWRGPLNIQCQRTPEGALGIYEFNGRFTGATAARALLGFDEIGAMLRHFAGVPLREPGPSRSDRVVRLPTSRCLPARIQAALERTGRYRRDDAG